MPWSATPPARDIECCLQLQNSLGAALKGWERLHRSHVPRSSCSLPGDSPQTMTGQCEVVKVCPLASQLQNFLSISWGLCCRCVEDGLFLQSSLPGVSLRVTLRQPSAQSPSEVCFWGNYLRHVRWSPPPPTSPTRSESVYRDESGLLFPPCPFNFPVCFAPVTPCSGVSQSCARTQRLRGSSNTKAGLFLAYFIASPERHSGLSLCVQARRWSLWS